MSIPVRPVVIAGWLIVSAVAVLEPVAAGAEDADDADDAFGWQTIRLAELPEPPADLRNCLNRGDVTFLVSGERPSVVDPGRSTGAKRGEFDAETRYRLGYTFKTRCQWQWAEYPDGKRLHFTVRYERLKLNVRHQVWLKEMPDRETFWDSALVRHELDHVRLSSDPRLSRRFVQAVNSHRRFELTREQSAPLIALATRRMAAFRNGRGSVLRFLTGDDAEPFLAGVINKEFERTIQLIEIRYQELDRQTEHGTSPVPEAGQLAEWLQ